MCPVTQYTGQQGITPTPIPAAAPDAGSAWFGKDKARYRISNRKLVLFREFLKAASDE
jgi:hypothetical protein